MSGVFVLILSINDSAIFKLQHMFEILNTNNYQVHTHINHNFGNGASILIEFISNAFFPLSSSEVSSELSQIVFISVNHLLIRFRSLWKQSRLHTYTHIWRPKSGNITSSFSSDSMGTVIARVNSLERTKKLRRCPESNFRSRDSALLENSIIRLEQTNYPVQRGSHSVELQQERLLIKGLEIKE